MPGAGGNTADGFARKVERRPFGPTHAALRKRHPEPRSCSRGDARLEAPDRGSGPRSDGRKSRCAEKGGGDTGRLSWRCASLLLFEHNRLSQGQLDEPIAVTWH